jgi:hypothetical protein
MIIPKPTSTVQFHITVSKLQMSREIKGTQVKMSLLLQNIVFLDITHHPVYIPNHGTRWM